MSIKNIVLQIKEDPKKSYPIIVIILLIIAYFVIRPKYEHTDNAYLNSNRIMIMPKVSGYVRSIDFEDNQKVVAGQRLFLIEQNDYINQRDLAEAALKSAEAKLVVLRSEHSIELKQIDEAQAAVNSTKAKQDLAEKNLQRNLQLRKDGTISEQVLDISIEQEKNAKAGAESAQAALEAARLHLEGILAQISDAEAGINLAKANCGLAKDALGNTEIKAPFSGVIANKAVHLGSFIAPGISLATLFDSSSIWVDANFKETQIHKMQKGQSAEVEIDALKGKKFYGMIDSLSPASGADFSLLPPENATGNFTKIVRRIPVKIKFKDDQDLSQLRSGMSVIVTIRVD